MSRSAWQSAPVATSITAVPEPLIDAMIQVESGGDPRAVSPKGAMGLMQLMPGTAKDMGVTDPFDPDQSRQGGTRYINQMLERYGGDPELALMAYNWGPGNVDSWVSAGRAGEVPRETQDYLGKLLPTAMSALGTEGAPLWAAAPAVSQDATRRFHEAFGAGPEKAPAAEPEDEGHSEFWKGFGGYLMNQGPEDVARSAEAIGVLMGSDWLQDTVSPAIMGLKGGDEEAFIPKVSDLSMIEWGRLTESPGEITQQIMDFAEYGLGTGLASTLPSLAASLAGGVGGTALGGPVVGVAGMIAGASATSYAQNTGPLYDDLLAEGLTPEQAAPWAAGGGVVLAALDAAFPATAAAAVLRGVKSKVRRGLIKRIVKEAGKGAVQEGITEALQSVASEAIVAEAGEREIDWRKMAIEASTGGAIGAMTGGLIGGVTGLRPDSPQAEVERGTETQPAPPEPPQAPPEPPEAPPTPEEPPESPEEPPVGPAEAPEAPPGAPSVADAVQLADAAGLPPPGAEVEITDAETGERIFGGTVELYDTAEDGSGLTARVVDPVTGRAFEAQPPYHTIQAAGETFQPAVPDPRQAELEAAAAERTLTVEEAEELGALLQGREGATATQAPAPAYQEAPPVAPETTAPPEIPEAAPPGLDLDEANRQLPQGFRIQSNGAGAIELVSPDGQVLEQWGESPANVQAARRFAEDYELPEAPGVFGEEPAPAAPPPAPEEERGRGTTVQRAPERGERPLPKGRPAKKGEVFRRIRKAAKAAPPAKPLPAGEAVQPDMLGGPDVTEREFAVRDAAAEVLAEMRADGLADAEIVKQLDEDFDRGRWEGPGTEFEKEVAQRVRHLVRPMIRVKTPMKEEAAETPTPEKAAAKEPETRRESGHFAAGQEAQQAGQPRELPSYFTKRRTKNAQDWLRGWDAAAAKAVERAFPTAEPTVTPEKPTVAPEEAPEAAPAAPAEEPARVVDPKVQAIRDLAGTLADVIQERAGTKQKLDWREFFALADNAFGGTQAEGAYTPRDAYDALEMAINMRMEAEEVDPRVPMTGQAHSFMHAINEMLVAVPTQSKRTREQIEFQQFSTPPHYAYAVAWAANIGAADVVLEPSAGTGSIAIFAKNAKPERVVVNEIAPRRAQILRDLGFEDVISENAEHLNAVLPADVKPTVVLMNPPFSETGGRLHDKAGLHIGLQHVEQGLKRLEPGGRLVAIVGRARRGEPADQQRWRERVSRSYALRANVGVSGAVYKKYGTTFDTSVLIFDKVTPDDTPVVSGEVQSLNELIDKLSEVRDARIAAREPAPAEPSRPEAAAPDRGGPDGRPAVPGATAGVGDRGAPGVSERVRAGAPGPRPAEQAAAPDDEAAAGRGEPAAAERPAGEPGPGRAESARGDEGVRGLDVGTQKEAEAEPAAFSNDVFSHYAPQRLSIPGAQPHPGALMQSTAMAAVLPPVPSYKPHLAPGVISEGRLSLAQLEAVVYAGQAHSQMLPAVEGETAFRRGFFIGDGTGVGKGREIAGIIQDNWNQGRRRAIWVTKDDSKLLLAAKRDYGALDPEGAKRIFKFVGPKDAIKARDGVLLSSFTKLARNTEARIEQLTAWLGKDFDGVIAFDEAHKMGNAIRRRGKRGWMEPSNTAIAGVELQRAFPNARVVYVSATGATEVYNLAYADRLGLWGRGMPFATKEAFISEVDQGGVAAMELVARDMKALGMYASRNLSYEDVRYERAEHEFTPAQRAAYDRLAEAWQVVLQNVNSALQITAGTEEGKVDGRAKSAAYSAFWSAHQRFFNQVLTSFQMPTVLEAIDRDLKAGHAPVLQLVNTMEAAQERALSREGALENLDELDLTPRDQLLQFVQVSFPTAKKEQYSDEDGNLRWRLVQDSAGNAVDDPEAVAMRDRLLEDLQTIMVPPGPLDTIIDHFGHEQVAEVTGRSRRVVEKLDDRTGKRGRVVERRTKTANIADISAFLDDKKRLLVFSAAGGTGVDYHASLDAKNQRLRRHYLVQAGWRADEAVQGLGRTHRSNQKQAPVYILASTDLKGHKRFLSSVARRLSQLGALTKGQRQATGGELFTERDNLENDYAKNAVNMLFLDLYRKKIEDLSFADVERQLGLNLRDDQGNVTQNKFPDVPQFLNRLLSLKIEMQNRLFDLFEERMDALVRTAEETGTLDVGVETYTADKLEFVQEKVVHTDEKSGAETSYVEIQESRRTSPRPWSAVAADPKVLHYVRNEKSKRIYAIQFNYDAMNADGAVVTRVRALDPRGGARHGTLDEFTPARWGSRQNLKTLTPEEAEPQWTADFEKVPEFTTHPLHLITGVILPIWDRLGGAGQRIYRLETDDGRRFLGRVIEPDQVRVVLENLGAFDKPQLTPQQAVEAVLQKGETLELSNGWKILRRRVSGENRIEVVGPKGGYSERKSLAAEGVTIETIAYKDRYFIPTGERAADVMANVTEFREIVRLASESEVEGEGDARLSRARPPATKVGARHRRAVIEAIRGAAARLAPEAKVRAVSKILVERVPGFEKTTEASGFGPDDEAAAVYLDGVITVALDVVGTPRAAASVVRHEAVHALKAMGFFTPREWGLLERESRRRWIKEFDLPQRPDEDIVVEEGIAYAFQAWKPAKPQYSAPINRLMRKMRLFFGRLGNALLGMGFQTVDDVFSSIELGEVGRRPLSPKRARWAAKAEMMKLPNLDEETVEAAMSIAGADLERVRAAAAWHGSPHDFDRFSTDKIGTGEGVQIIAWGLYFGGKKEVAEHYKNVLGKSRRIVSLRGVPLGPIESLGTAKAFADVTGIGHYRALSIFLFLSEPNTARTIGDAIASEEGIARTSTDPHVQREAADAAEKLRSLRSDIQISLKEEGRVYKVNLVPDEDEYLYWDKPLSEQSAKVRQSLSGISVDPDRDLQNGAVFYRHLEQRFSTPKGAAMELLRVGIPGIKYLDQVSRLPSDNRFQVAGGKQPRAFRTKTAAEAHIKEFGGDLTDRGEGTYNYVIFDDRHVEITGKFSTLGTIRDHAKRFGQRHGGLAMETAPGVEVERPEIERDLNPLKRLFFVPARLFKDWPALSRAVARWTVRHGQFQAALSRLQQEWDGLTLGLTTFELGELTAILFRGDANAEVYTAEDLDALVDEDGVPLELSENVKTTYLDTTRFIEKLGRSVDQHERDMRNYLRRHIKPLLLRTIAKASPLSKEEVNKLINQRYALRTQFRAGDGDMAAIGERLERIEAKLGYEKGADEPLSAAIDQLDIVDATLNRTTVRTRVGYVPHKFFGSWAVYRIVEGEDADGAPIENRELVADYAEHGFHPTQAEAVTAANRYAGENPDERIVVRPVGFRFAGTGHMTLRGPQYTALMGQLQDALEIDQNELREAVDGVVRPRSKRRWAGFKQFRKGVQGYSRDLDRVMRAHIGEVTRYTMLDKVKYEAITLEDRMKLHREATQRPVLGAAWRAYVRDILGSKQSHEAALDELFERGYFQPMNLGLGAGITTFVLAGGLSGNPFVGMLLGGWLGYRFYQARATSAGIGGFTTRALTGELLGTTAHLKLGAFLNVFSPVVNLTQIVLNTAAVVPYKHMAQGFAMVNRAVAQHYAEVAASTAAGRTYRDPPLIRMLRRHNIDPVFKHSEISPHLYDKPSKLARASMFLFDTVEKYNRSVTFFAAYSQAKAGKAKGVRADNEGAAQRHAMNVVNRTQFDYSNVAKPEILRDVFMRVPLQFKNFVAQQIAFVAGLEDKKEVVKFLTHMFLVAGVLGLPGWQLLDWLIQWFTDGDVSPTVEVKRIALEMAARGELDGTIAQVIARGMPALVGIDISSRTGMGDKFLPTLRLDDLIGPMASTMLRANQLAEAEAGIVDQLRNLSTGLGGPLKALQSAANGMPLEGALLDPGAFIEKLGDERTVITNPRKMLRPEGAELDVVDLVLMGVGGSPTEVSHVYDFAHVANHLRTRRDRLNARFMNRIAQAHRKFMPHDQEAFQAAMVNVIAQANEIEHSLNPASIRRLIRELQMPRDLRTIRQAPRALRRELLEMRPSN